MAGSGSGGGIGAASGWPLPSAAMALSNAAVPDRRDAGPGDVVGGQLRQDVAIDIVIVKCGRVLLRARPRNDSRYRSTFNARASPGVEEPRTIPPRARVCGRRRIKRATDALVARQVGTPFRSNIFSPWTGVRMRAACSSVVVEVRVGEILVALLITKNGAEPGRERQRCHFRWSSTLEPSSFEDRVDQPLRRAVGKSGRIQLDLVDAPASRGKNVSRARRPFPGKARQILKKASVDEVVDTSFANIDIS